MGAKKNLKILFAQARGFERDDAAAAIYFQNCLPKVNKERKEEEECVSFFFFFLLHLSNALDKMERTGKKKRNGGPFVSLLTSN